MAKQGGGSIINISSVGGLVPDISQVSYGTSKAAINYLTKLIAVHEAKNNIRCNAVLPGMTATDAVQEKISEGFKEINVLPVKVKHKHRIFSKRMYLHSNVDYIHNYGRYKKSKKQIIPVSSLPDTGEEGVIYVYSNQFYLWDGEQFISPNGHGLDESLVDEKIAVAKTEANEYTDKQIMNAFTVVEF